MGSCYFVSDGQGRAGLEVTFELRKGRPPPGGDLGPKFGGHRGKKITKAHKIGRYLAC